MSAAAEILRPRPQVLVVDDEAGMRTALEVSFARQGWQAEAASGKADALSRMRLRKPALVVSDVRMNDGDGFEVMRAAREMAADIAVILLTGFASVPDAVRAMKSGACEYLVKPVPIEQLLAAAARVRAQAREFRVDSSSARDSAGQMIGSSPALLRTLAQARHAAEADADILIEAESGTGKELLARMIHGLSGRRNGPFVAVNCAGIPEALLESELFGHGRGAFTGAESVQAGKFQLADGGTLLLDEIGEMPLSLQPKLLRALQEREFYRLGESHPVKVNIRVIATTNRPLAAMVNDGRFRADLYYRLNVIPLTLPPLRERRSDIRDLARHFAKMFSSASQPADLPEALFGQFESYGWPGNVRELANVVRRTLALGLQHFSDLNSFNPDSISITPPSRETHSSCFDQARLSFSALEPGISLEAMEKRLFQVTLAATGGNRSRAAEMLGVSLRTVRNKVREYNLPPRSNYVAGHD